MALLKAQSFELEFTYHDLTSCNEIEYALQVKWEGKPFFNPELLKNDTYYVNGGKFIVQESMNDDDWLMCFFIELLKTRKGGQTEKCEPPEIVFRATTWEDKRAEKEKSWEGKTCLVKQLDGTVENEPYSETMKMFVPFWENNIEFSIQIPSCSPEGYFESKQYTSFTLTVETTFSNLLEFLEEFQEEMHAFYHKFADKIKYLGNEKYEIIEKE
jgi:hypothetical protein